MADQPGIGVCEQSRQLREGALPYWRPLYQARVEEREFLDGFRYANDNGLYNRDRRFEQFRGQEITNVTRHKAAVATMSPMSLEARPADATATPDDCELGVSIMEAEIEDAQKGVLDLIEEVAQDALDTRAGAALIEYDPDLGEVYGSWIDPNHIMFTPGISNPYHLKCWWMQMITRMRISDVERFGKLTGKAKWQHTDDLKGDAEAAAASFRAKTNPDGSPRLDVEGPNGILGVPGATVDEDHIWVLWCWYKNDPEGYDSPGDSYPIPPEDRYHACTDPECSYRGETAGTLVEVGALDKVDQLDEFGEPCPMCGSPTMRLDKNKPADETVSTPRGRRLIVFPLLQTLENDEPFYDGDWICPRARSFPLLWVTAYPRGGRPMGDSDTTRNWDAQVALDNLMTMAFDRIMSHQAYYIVPQKGLYDAWGRRFEFRDDQYNVIFADTHDPSVPAPTVVPVEGSALDGAWPTYWNAVQTSLLAHQGITDFGLTPESSKDIPVGTVQTIERQGEIPVTQFLNRMNRRIGEWFNVWWDYACEFYDEDKIQRMRIDDEDVVAGIAGKELPRLDFSVSKMPEFEGLTEHRRDAFRELFQLIQDPNQAQFIDVFAKINKYPPSIVRMVKQKLAERDAAAATAPQLGPPAPTAPLSPDELMQQTAPPGPLDGMEAMQAA